MTNEEFTAEMAEWEANRIKALKHPDGYLSLVGLCWLNVGENTFGSASHNHCQFPADLPETMGHYTVGDSGITISIRPGIEVLHNGDPVQQMTILADADPDGPTILQMGTFSWFVIKRGEALGIRLRDSHSQMLQSFEKVDRFPNRSDWRITARFNPHEEPKAVPIPTILGTDSLMTSPGTVSIKIAGEARELIALKTGDPDRLFLIVADGLAGTETYGGGRFLTSEPIQPDGTVILDFNKATNPPCAFSPYATCPKPPDENKFTVNIPAGEKLFHY